jgi:cytochrome c5
MASFTSLLWGFLLLLAGPTTSDAQNAVELRSPSAFSNIVETQPRSRALFTEAAKVIMNPRCMSCHPASDSPTQGNDMYPHPPPCHAGTDGDGVPGNTCSACHLDRNVDILVGQQTSFRSLPGHPS